MDSQQEKFLRKLRQQIKQVRVDATSSKKRAKVFRSLSDIVREIDDMLGETPVILSVGRPQIHDPEHPIAQSPLEQAMQMARSEKPCQ